LKTRNRRLETITNLLIKTPANLRERSRRMFLSQNQQHWHKCYCVKQYVKQTNPFGRPTLQGMDNGWRSEMTSISSAAFSGVSTTRMMVSNYA